MTDCLVATSIIDSDHPSIVEYASNAAGGIADPAERAVRLYYAVRDPIVYDPYVPFWLPQHYRASDILKRGRGFCVSKASLLCALGRASSIPSRLGFADVRNHLASKRFLEMLGSDLFVYHGFVEFYLDGRWLKATPAFNRELCERHGVDPLEFDGREDSVFQTFSREHRLFMEYVTDRGWAGDVPVDAIVEAWKTAYGRERVTGWISRFEQ